MKKLLFLLSLSSLGFYFQPHQAVAQRVRVVYDPPRNNYRPACPGADYTWVEGYWTYDRYYRRDVWVEGYWVRREPDYQCDNNCCHKHKHRFKRNKHNRGYAYGRY